MKVTNQRRLASEVLDAGKNRVFIDPARLDDIKKAITKEDIRKLVKEGAIRARKKKGISRFRAKIKAEKRENTRMKGHGHRKGTINARMPLKTVWIHKIRTLRGSLKEMKSKGEVTTEEYRKLYKQAKGNLFKSKRHLKEHISIMLEKNKK